MTSLDRQLRSVDVVPQVRRLGVVLWLVALQLIWLIGTHGALEAQAAPAEWPPMQATAVASIATARTLADEGRIDEAQALLQALAQQYPQRPEPHIDLAALAARQQQPAQARAHLEAALQTSPAHAQAYEALQMLNARLAQRAYAQALQPGTDQPVPELALPWATVQAASATSAPMPASAASTASAANIPKAITAPTSTTPWLYAGVLALLLSLLAGGVWAARKTTAQPASASTAQVDQDTQPHFFPSTQQGAPASAAAATPAAGAPEAELIEVYKLIGSGALPQALQRAEALAQAQPRFQLAQLTYGDLLLAQNGALPAWGGGHDSPAYVALRQEATQRLHALRDQPAPDTVPQQVLQLGGSARHVVAVDASRSRLYVLEHQGGQLRLVASHYAAIGSLGVGKQQEGDMRTPLGVYYITSRLEARQLGDFYGAGALPLNYPNDHDRHLGRTGANIWLHGTPSAQYARSPRSTNGCIVLPNADLSRWLKELAPRHTPVIIAMQLHWVSPRAQTAERQAAQAALERWRQARGQSDIKRLMALYAQHFDNGEFGLDAWRSRLLQEMHAGERDRQLEDLSLLTWHERSDLMVATFTEVPRGAREGIPRRQYWTRASGQWKIFSEGVLE